MYCELANYILPPLFLKKIFFYTFRELGTSIFALNNINERKHGVSKLGFISSMLLKMLNQTEDFGVLLFH